MLIEPKLTNTSDLFGKPAEKQNSVSVDCFTFALSSFLKTSTTTNAFYIVLVVAMFGLTAYRFLQLHVGGWPVRSCQG